MTLFPFWAYCSFTMGSFAWYGDRSNTFENLSPVFVAKLIGVFLVCHGLALAVVPQVDDPGRMQRIDVVGIVGGGNNRYAPGRYDVLAQVAGHNLGGEWVEVRAEFV